MPPIILSFTHFAHGPCVGIDSDQVLQAAAYAGLHPVALFFNVSRNFEALVALGCLKVLSGWLRTPPLMTVAYPAVWLVLMLGVALVAAYGADVVAREGFLLTATTIGWHAASGIIATFVGIGLVVLAQVDVWGELPSRNRVSGLERSASSLQLYEIASCLLVTIFFSPCVFDFNEFIRPNSQSGIQNGVGQATL